MALKIGDEKFLTDIACEVCHTKSATEVVTDFRLLGFTTDEDGNKWERSEVHSYHFFCDEHKRKSNTLSFAEQAVFSPESVSIKVGHLEVTGNSPKPCDWHVKLDGVSKPAKRLVITLDVNGPPVVQMEWYPTFEFKKDEKLGVTVLQPMLPTEPDAPVIRRGREFI